MTAFLESLSANPHQTRAREEAQGLKRFKSKEPGIGTRNPEEWRKQRCNKFSQGQQFTGQCRGQGNFPPTLAGIAAAFQGISSLNAETDNLALLRSTACTCLLSQHQGPRTCSPSPALRRTRTRSENRYLLWYSLNYGPLRTYREDPFVFPVPQPGRRRFRYPSPDNHRTESPFPSFFLCSPRFT